MFLFVYLTSVGVPLLRFLSFLYPHNKKFHKKIAGILLANDSIEWKFSRDISQSLNALAKMEYGVSVCLYIYEFMCMIICSIITIIIN